MVRVIGQTDGLKCVGAFASCESALAKLNDGPHPDVILLDVRLPGMSGVDGVREFKTIAQKTHVLMLTMCDDDTTVFQALCAGASGYLLKTGTPESITAAIVEVINGGAPMSPSIARSVLHLFTKFAPKQTDYGLTTREKSVLDLLVQGRIKKQIADELRVSYHTIDKHVRSIYDKLQVHSLSAAVAKAVRERLF